jgi:hypothetical protein
MSLTASASAQRAADAAQQKIAAAAFGAPAASKKKKKGKKSSSAKSSKGGAASKAAAAAPAKKEAGSSGVALAVSGSAAETRWRGYLAGLDAVVALLRLSRAGGGGGAAIDATGALWPVLADASSFVFSSAPVSVSFYVPLHFTRILLTV